MDIDANLVIKYLQEQIINLSRENAILKAQLETLKEGGGGTFATTKGEGK